MALLTLIGVWVDGPADEDVPRNTAFQIDWPRGTIATIDLRLVDNNGDLVDLDIAGTDKLELSVRKGFQDGPFFVRAATKSSELGLYTFSVALADTVDMSGKFTYDVWATRGSAQRQVVGTAYFNVTPRINLP